MKRDSLGPAGSTDAVLGNWYVTLTQVDGGNAFVYMSERSLLSFIMLEGERITPVKLFSSFVRGLLIVLEMAGHPESVRDRILRDYSVGTVSRADDLSVLGSLTNIALDYAAFIEGDGGLPRCNLSEIIMSINSRPSKRLGFDSPLEVTASLLRGAAT
jgi:hypothetical protein